MAVGKSLKMYLTIFVATTCIYMVLYQYHISRQPITSSAEIIKNKDISAELRATETTTLNNGNGKLLSSTASLVKRYNLFLWSPMSLLTTQQKQQQPPQPPQPPQQQQIQQERTSASSSSPSHSSSLASSTQISSTSQIGRKLSRIEAAASPILSPITLSTPSVAPSSSSSISALNSSSSIQHKKASFKSNAIRPISTDKLLLSNTNDNSNNTIASNTTTTTITTATNTTATLKLLSASKNTTTKSRSTTSLSSASASKSTRFKTTFANKFVPVVDPPPLYIITPTYRRPEQLAELTRLGYTLKHVVNLLWLVIEDANVTSPLVVQTLNRIGVPYEYFLAPMPEEYKKTKKAKPRGVSNRNRGLEYLRDNATHGVFYFADDDNTYDISIFEQMRYTKKVSMWPVGLVTKYGVSSPIIRKGKIEGFYDGWIGGRKYPVDMAGFAVSVQFLHDRPAAKMPFKPGYEEDGFLKSLAPLNNTEIELLATNCTEVLTWHTQTKKNGAAEALNMTKYHGTNLVFIDKILVRP